MPFRFNVRVLVTWAALAFAAAPMAMAQNSVTKKFGKDFDVYDETVTFAEQWIESHPSVKATYDRLVKAAMADPNEPPPDAGQRVAIKWLVPQYTAQHDDQGGTRDVQYVFLVKQALSQRFSGGYSVEHNIVARILVTTHEILIPDPKKEGDYLPESVEATFAFAGFVKVHLDPVGDGPASASQGTGKIPPEPNAKASKEAELKKYLYSLEGTYGWQPPEGVPLYDFFKDGRVHVQGPDGEATMWEGKWTLKGNQLTISYQDNDGKLQKHTYKATITPDGLLLDDTLYKRYKPEGG
jgi:hypothetical protein